MDKEKEFAVIYWDDLQWPPALQLPSQRFRLFVAANVAEISTKVISDFAFAALSKGMVYFCAWGPGCERFHDIVDELKLKDERGERKFIGPRVGDVVVTTWHDCETLQEALEFFAICAAPTDGFEPDSHFRVVVCVNDRDWAATATRFLQSVEFFV
jgi:hypothetical protein